jgi:hypothetical protein
MYTLLLKAKCVKLEQQQGPYYADCHILQYNIKSVSATGHGCHVVLYKFYLSPGYMSGLYMSTVYTSASCMRSLSLS